MAPTLHDRQTLKYHGNLLLWYRAKNCQPVDTVACTAAKNSGGVYLDQERVDKNWRGAAGKASAPKYGPWIFAHGTSVPTGLVIARDGHMLPSTKGIRFLDHSLVLLVSC